MLIQIRATNARQRSTTTNVVAAVVQNNVFRRLVDLSNVHAGTSLVVKKMDPANLFVSICIRMVVVGKTQCARTRKGVLSAPNLAETHTATVHVPVTNFVGYIQKNLSSGAACLCENRKCKRRSVLQ